MGGIIPKRSELDVGETSDVFFVGWDHLAFHLGLDKNIQLCPDAVLSGGRTFCCTHKSRQHLYINLRHGGKRQSTNPKAGVDFVLMSICMLTCSTWYRMFDVLVWIE